MSRMGRIMSLFPLLHALLIVANLVVGILVPWALIALLFTIWLFPLCCWHVHNRIWPLVEGMTDFASKAYAPWWGSYQLQHLFLVLPGLERVLHLVPGLYSAWLRAWGSKIGKQVFWTPHTLILDRSLLDFGDGIIVGHRCSISSHVISFNKKHELMLYVRKVEIGSGVFVGAGSDIGPGVHVAPGTHLKLESKLYPNMKVGPDSAPHG